MFNHNGNQNEKESNNDIVFILSNKQLKKKKNLAMNDVVKLFPVLEAIC